MESPLSGGLSDGVWEELPSEKEIADSPICEENERANQTNTTKPLLPQPTEALEGTLPSPTIEAISPKEEGTKDNLQIPDDTATEPLPWRK